MGDPAPEDDRVLSAFEGWKDGRCRYLCAECGRVFATMLSFHYHASAHHGLAADAYRARHGAARIRTERVDCVLCGARVVWDYVKLRVHMERAHQGMDLFQYFRDHVYWAQYGKKEKQEKDQEEEQEESRQPALDERVAHQGCETAHVPFEEQTQEEEEEGPSRAATPVEPERTLRRSKRRSKKPLGVDDGGKECPGSRSGSRSPAGKRGKRSELESAATTENGGDLSYNEKDGESSPKASASSEKKTEEDYQCWISGCSYLCTYCSTSVQQSRSLKEHLLSKHRLEVGNQSLDDLVTNSTLVRSYTR